MVVGVPPSSFLAEAGDEIVNAAVDSCNALKSDNELLLFFRRVFPPGDLPVRGEPCPGWVLIGVLMCELFGLLGFSKEKAPKVMGRS